MTQVKIFKNATEDKINLWLKDHPDIYNIKIKPIGIGYPSDDIAVMIIYKEDDHNV